MPDFPAANELLHRFRMHIAPYFPFIVLPETTTAEEYCAERPCHYIAILTVASRDAVQQKALGKMVLRQLAERMFINGERSLDLLLGALTYGSGYVLRMLLSMISVAHDVTRSTSF